MEKKPGSAYQMPRTDTMRTQHVVGSEGDWHNLGDEGRVSC